MKKGVQDGNRDPLEVANYLLKKKEIAFTPMKLIKMAYIAHGWFMASFSNDVKGILPLIREDVQAWRYGPVFPSIFHAVKQYSYFKIDDLLFGVQTGEDFSRREKALIDGVASAYGDLNASTLSDMTHEKGTPWYMMYERNILFKRIPNELIYDYYKRKMLEKEEDDEPKRRNAS